MAALAGVYVLIAVVVGVFLTVVSVVAMVKVIQIAEDLRYIRSKSDVSVSRPKSWKNTLVVCLIVSFIIILVVGGFLMTAGVGLTNGVH